MIQTLAVVLKEPRQLGLQTVDLLPASDSDVVVNVNWSGISTGTEKLLWDGRMPSFPGMGYPLVPGYESIGTVVAAGPDSGHSVGELVFVPGSRHFSQIRGLFGGAAATLISPGKRVIQVDDSIGEHGVLIALAATAQHAVSGGAFPELIVGHGVLGRLIARLCVAAGGAPPIVWESREDRRSGALGYEVIDPSTDDRCDYKVICDVSGDASLIDSLIRHLAPGGEIILAGFYSERISFAFPAAFMREARLRVAAEWREPDIFAVRKHIDAGTLRLDDLITHRQPVANASGAYRTAFEDATCLKMVLDWKGRS